MLPRSYLFVPGNRPERFGKALASEADAVVLDLEDAVAPDARRAARESIAQWCHERTQADLQRIVLRINDANTREFASDLALAGAAGLRTVMLPKAETVEQVRAVRAAVPATSVLALVETAVGVANVRHLAHAPGLQRLVFGTLDYALDLDLDIAASGEPLLAAAAELVLASRLAELAAPVAGVTPQLDDDARVAADAAWARSHGFGAKLCLHPRQVAPIHATLTPGPQQIAWAQRVVAAEAASPGAARLDGRMIDRPVFLQAQRTLQRARP